MTRIAIIGISGSGKSTLANKLGKKLNYPAIHLDKHFWDVGWKERYSREEFKKIAEEFANTDNWIIDGNYRSTIDMRLERADTIIFLDFPKWLGLWRSFKRVFNRSQPFDKSEGVRERIDFLHVKYVLTYPTHQMRSLVEKYKDTKRIFIARNDKEKEEILNSID